MASLTFGIEGYAFEGRDRRDGVRALIPSHRHRCAPPQVMLDHLASLGARKLNRDDLPGLSMAPTSSKMSGVWSSETGDKIPDDMIQ